MGIIDAATHALQCSCGAAESVQIFQYGSSYGGTWQPGKPFARFVVSWAATGSVGPTIRSAQCRSCGGVPTISVS